MKHYEVGFAALLAVSLFGCDKTAEGAKNDIRENSINASKTIKESIDNGANEAKEAGKNLGAATQLTPRIKNALNAEPKLNADGNLIDVDSTKDEVTLSGHVLSEGLKSLAGKLAKEELVKAKATQKFTNNLKVEVVKK